MITDPGRVKTLIQQSALSDIKQIQFYPHLTKKKKAKQNEVNISCGHTWCVPNKIKKQKYLNIKEKSVAILSQTVPNRMHQSNKIWHQGAKTVANILWTTGKNKQNNPKRVGHSDKSQDNTYN